MPDFPIKLGSRNGGNSRVMRGLSNGVIRDAFAGSWWWIQNVKRGDFALAAATSQAITLATTYPRNPFPTNVDRSTPCIYVATPLSGGAISAATIEMGDAGDPDGLVTATSCFTGVSGFLPPNLTGSNPTAAEYADRVELAMSPSFTLRSTGANLSAATAFNFWLMIKFSPLASV